MKHFRLAPMDMETFYVGVMSGQSFSTTGFKVILKRRFTPYIVSWYIPTSVLVVVSWISFCIPVDLVPGRMVKLIKFTYSSIYIIVVFSSWQALLVTVFLMLINISNSSHSQNPMTRYLNALDIWLITCIIFVAMALFEYAILLRKRWLLATRYLTKLFNSA